jgi:FAD/FMN-containing dehydrogenase
MELNGRAGVGTGLLRVDGDTAAQIDAVRRLRDRSDLFNQVTILRTEPAVKAAVDVWGGNRDTAALQAAVKRAFDPAGILNAGRGPW